MLPPFASTSTVTNDVPSVEQWYMQSQQHPEIGLQGTMIDLSPAPGHAVLISAVERVTVLENQMNKLKRDKLSEYESTERQLSLIRTLVEAHQIQRERVETIQGVMEDTQSALEHVFNHFQWAIVNLCRLLHEAGQGEANALEADFVDGFQNLLQGEGSDDDEAEEREEEREEMREEEEEEAERVAEMNSKELVSLKEVNAEVDHQE